MQGEGSVVVEMTPESGRGFAEHVLRKARGVWPMRLGLPREDGRGVGQGVGWGVEDGVVRGVLRGVLRGVVRGVRCDEPACEAEDDGCRLYAAGACTDGASPCVIRGPPSAARSSEAA